MRTRLLVYLLLISGLLHGQGADPSVRLKIMLGDGRTTLGNIDMVLLRSVAPLTVTNFLSYVNKGAFNKTIFHRSVANFIVQTGGYILNGNDFTAKVAQDAPVRNEYNVSNTRGTVAMAKLGSNPNSATSEFFFNLADNSANLNNQNGGFTVFARVADEASQAVIDRIAAAPVPANIFISPWDTLPLFNYRCCGNPTAANIMLIDSITMLEAPAPPPAISSNGIASAFSGVTRVAAGSYIEIYGTNLSGTTRGWASADFTNDGKQAPTTIDQVRVTINGVPAYVYYVSPGQINVQLPEGIPTGDNIPVVVTFNGVSSAPAAITVREFAGSILAPAAFKVGDVQYVAAQHAATGKFVSGGNIPSVDTAPAVPGETLIFYGTGFGPITPNTPALAGQVAEGRTAVTNPVTVKIGDAEARVTYAGLVEKLIGLYQFNIEVPANVANGDQPVTVTQGREAIAQKLTIAVKTN